MVRREYFTATPTPAHFTALCAAIVGHHVTNALLDCPRIDLVAVVAGAPRPSAMR